MTLQTPSAPPLPRRPATPSAYTSVLCGRRCSSRAPALGRVCVSAKCLLLQQNVHLRTFLRGKTFILALALNLPPLPFPLSWHFMEYQYKLINPSRVTVVSPTVVITLSDSHIFLRFASVTPRASWDLFVRVFPKPQNPALVHGALPRLGGKWQLENTIQHAGVGVALRLSQFLEPSSFPSQKCTVFKGRTRRQVWPCICILP